MVEQHYKPLEVQFSDLVRHTSTTLASLAGHELGKAGSGSEWCDGPKFVWRNVANPPASNDTRTTPVSRAWRRTATWLRTVVADRSFRSSAAAKWKLLHYRHHLLVHDSALQEQAAAFRAWRQLIGPAVLNSLAWITSSLSVAAKKAGGSERWANTAASTRFAEWVSDGPAGGLRRQHLFARTATGWTSDQVGGHKDTVLSEHDELDGITEQQLRAALDPTLHNGSPVGAQHTANVERTR